MEILLTLFLKTISYISQHYRYTYEICLGCTMHFIQNFHTYLVRVSMSSIHFDLLLYELWNLFIILWNTNIYSTEIFTVDALAFVDWMSITSPSSCFVFKVNFSWFPFDFEVIVFFSYWLFSLLVFSHEGWIPVLAWKFVK